MTAQDEDNNLSRLDKAKEYANSLVALAEENGQGISASVVATKGTAVTLVPQTEDYNAVRTQIEALSPSMISTIGSNIALGIEQGTMTFQNEVARQNTIILFTDCEETEGSIEKTLFQTTMKGINVFIIGFGSEIGADIVTSGSDSSKNIIHTSLDENKIKASVKSVKERTSVKKISVEYYNADSEEGKEKIISTLYPTTFETETAPSSEQIGYEAKNVSHHKLFTLLAMIFLVVGTFVGFYKFSSAHGMLLMVFCVFPLFFVGCRATVEQQVCILQGSFFWHHGNYQKAEMKFLQVLGNSDEQKNDFVYQYAVLGLGSSYAMQNENLSSFTRLKSISEDAPQNIQFSSNYNMGVLSFSQGEYNDAKNYFRKALETNPDSIDAKINYELAMWHTEKEFQNKNSLKADSMDSPSILKDSIFSIIGENDRNLWKSSQKRSESQNQLDY